jgi:hypothetical protein
MSNGTSSGKRRVRRRQFIQGAGAALAAFTILKPGLIRGAEANSKVRLGLIGCGNRGTWIADLFRNHGGYEITALADYFEDKVNDYGNRIQVPADKRFTGLSGYKRLLDSGAVDAIAIESPPYFHPNRPPRASKRVSTFIWRSRSRWMCRGVRRSKPVERKPRKGNSASWWTSRHAPTTFTARRSSGYSLAI